MDVVNQIHFTGESKCANFSPNPHRKNICTLCFKEISKHTKESIRSKEDIIEALEYKQSHERVGSLILAASESPINRGCLYLGGYRPSINQEFLKEAKITHILNAASGLSDFFGAKYQNLLSTALEQLHITYMTLPWQDTSTFAIQFADLKKGVEFIEDGRRHGNVLVHCAQGKSRSVTIVIAYIMASSQLSFEKALDLVQEKRKMAEPNPGFVKMLSSLHEDEEFTKLRDSFNYIEKT